MRQSRAVVVSVVLGLATGLATDAGATELARHAPRLGRVNLPSPRANDDFLAGVPDSALRLPPNLGASMIAGSPRRSTPNDFPAVSRANSSLPDAHRGSIANSVTQIGRAHV